jgi:hypothetical protein
MEDYSPRYHNTLLKVTSTDFSVLYLYLCRKYIKHIHPPLHSSFTHPLPLSLPLNITCFIFLSFIICVFLIQ